jgi:hypothetical protein
LSALPQPWTRSASTPASVLSVAPGDASERAKASGIWCNTAVVSKLMAMLRLRSRATCVGQLVGTIAQKAVDGAASLTAHTVHTCGGVRLMQVFVLSGRASHEGQ